MNKVTIQVPVDKALKISAEKVAIESGFSSLQEALRVFMTQFANKAVIFGFSQKTEDEILTPEQEAILTKQYNQAKKDIENGKGFVAHSVEDMMKQLRS